MKENLIDYFDCASNEELYQLLANSDEQVNELTTFYNSMKESIREDVFKIERTHSSVEFLNKEKCAPEKDTITVASLNSKLEITGWSNFPSDMEKAEAYNQFFSTKTIALMTFCHAEDIDFALEAKEYFETFKIDMLDIHVIDPNNKENVFSFAESRSNYYVSFEETFKSQHPFLVNLNSYLNNTKSIINKKSQSILLEENLDIDVINNIYKLKGLEEFNDYYIEHHLIGSHVIQDESKLIDTFKVGLQDRSQENLYLVSYDENRIINSVDKLGIGSLNSAVVPYQQIVSKYLQPNVKGAVMVHNHPSGHTDPSEADINVAIVITDVADGIGKEFIESYIVGYKGHDKLSEYDSRLNDRKERAINESKEVQLSIISLNDRLDQLENKKDVTEEKFRVDSFREER